MLIYPNGRNGRDRVELGAAENGQSRAGASLITSTSHSCAGDDV